MLALTCEHNILTFNPSSRNISSYLLIRKFKIEIKKKIHKVGRNASEQ